MPYYPEEIVESVRERNDIVDVVGSYVSLKKRGSTYFGLCPFHNEKTPSFSVTPSKQMYYCFGCGAGGNVFTFLMEYEHMEFVEAVQELAGRCGVTLPERELDDREKNEKNRREKMLDANREAARYYYAYMKQPGGSRIYEYFKGRGLSDETIRRFGLGASGTFGRGLYSYLKRQGFDDSLMEDAGLICFSEDRGAYDRFWSRAMFPIMDVRRRVIGFGGRVLGDGEPKYLNSPESKLFDKSRNLYGLCFAKSSRREGLILCEGYMDVIALHQAGFDNAVASLGTAFTSGHAALVKRYGGSCYICFDSDGAGRKAALRAIPILNSAGIRSRVIDMTPHKDPDEFIKSLGAEAFEERIKNAENSFMFRVRISAEGYDLKDPAEKTEFFKSVSRMLLEFEEPLERENYITAIADKYHTGFENLRQLVAHEAGVAELGGVRQQEENEKSKRIAEQKADGYSKAQGFLLTAMSEDPGIYAKLKEYISPEDFREEVYNKVAMLLFSQLEEGRVNPAGIIDSFQDEESARLVSGLFHTRLEISGEGEDYKKALKDSVIKLKDGSMEREIADADPTDFAAIQRMIDNKRKIDGLKKIFF